MPKFRKKPVEIEAVQYAVHERLVKGMCNSTSCYTAGNSKPHVHTIHDGQIVSLEVGDWIISEPDGEHFYPCKPDIFALTYEPSAPPTSAEPLSARGFDFDDAYVAYLVFSNGGLHIADSDTDKAFRVWRKRDVDKLLSARTSALEAKLKTAEEREKKLREALENPRFLELVERLVSCGHFPNMSAGEGHELYGYILAAREAVHP